jgi:hypothetical protein
VGSKTLSGNAGSEAMKRIVKIEGVGNVVFPDSMSDREVSEVADRLYDDANPANEPNKRPVSPPTPSAAGTSEDTSDWRRIQTSDKKHFLIHPEDLPEAQRRDLNLQVLDQPDQP